MKNKSNLTDKFKSLVLVLFAVIFNAVFLRSEVTVSTYSLNDEVLHLTATQEASNAFKQGLNPTDFWFPEIGLGFPIFHYYQHLPHLVLAGVNQLTSFFIPLPRLFDLSQYLLLILFPLSIFWAMRRLDFDYLAAGLSALTASLLSTNNLYGFDYGSYLWRGDGLYTQLWAMFFLPLALAEIYRTIRKNGGWFWPVILSTIVLLSNLLYGYILILSAILFVFLRLNKTEIFSRIKRLAIVFILTALVTSYFFIPFVLDQNYLNRSIWEEAFKYNSFGALAVLKNLFTGNLLDYGRLPILTIFFFGAVIFTIKQWRKENYRFLLLLTGFWLCLYFGRPTWGPLLNLLPFSQDIHLHRFIGGFHLGAIMLIGAGLSLIWQKIKKLSGKIPKLALIILILFFAPVFRERINYYQQNHQWKKESQKAFSEKSREITEIKKAFENLPPGRVYAGLPADFGKYPYYKIGSAPLYSLLPQLGLDSFGYAYYALPLTTDIRLHFDNTKLEQYNLFNIRYVLLHKTWTAPYYYSKIKEFEDYVLYQIPTTGYFDLVDVPAVFYGDKNDFYNSGSKWLFSSLPKLKQHPVIEIGNELKETYGLPTFPFQKVDEKIFSDLTTNRFPQSEPVGGRVISETVKSNAYLADVQVARASMLMLKINYHPNWHVYVDGVETDTVMLMPSFIGVKLAAGTHHISFQYQPQPLHGYLMILGVLTLIILGLTEWRKKLFTQFIKKLNLTCIIPFEKMQINFKTKLGLYLLFFAIYLISASGHFWSTDHISVYLTTQSLVENHSLAIKPIHDTAVGKDGNSYSVFGLGQSILSIPFYLTGKIVDAISPPAVRKYFNGINIGDWGGTVPIFFVSLFNQFVTPLTCVLFFLFCLRLGFSKKISFLTTLIFGFSTATWVSAHDYFQHPLETLLLLLSIYILYSHRMNLQPRHVFFSGSVLAFGILTRINLFVVAPALLIYLLIINRNRISQIRFQQGLQFLLPILFALAVILILNYFKFGDIHITDPIHEYQGFSLSNLLIGLYGNLFSVGRSIFLYSPPALISLYLFRKFHVLHCEEGLLFLVISLIYLVTYSVYGDWAGGWSWGPRFLVPILPFLIIPIGLAFESKLMTIITGALVALGVGVQIIGVIINVSYVTWDWMRMNLNPTNAYLFVPELSPIPTHLKALLTGRHIDLWLLEIYKQFGLSVFLITLAVPLIIMAGAIIFFKTQ